MTGSTAVRGGRPTIDSITVARYALIIGGAIILLIGAIIMLETVKLPKLIGLAVWLIAAIILHDAIIAPVVFVAGFVLRKAGGRRIPSEVLAIVQAGLVIGLMFSVILVPEIAAQKLTDVFPTLLPFDYAGNLAILWIGTLVLTAAAVAAYLVVARRRSSRLK